jgi:hypothetical protein
MHWLEKERDPKKPFFLYLSHKAVHSDPLPPPRYQHQYDNTEFKIPARSQLGQVSPSGIWIPFHLALQ